MKRIMFAQVAENAPLAPDIYKLVLTLPVGAEPALAGQFVNVYLGGGERLLPRPISICRREGRALTLVYRTVGEGTRELSTLHAGAALRVSDPLGHGYTLPERGHVLLVGGGVGVPPLVEAAHEARAKGLPVTAALGYRDALFLQEDFARAAGAVLIATEDGSAGFCGNVVELLKTQSLPADTTVLACGPKPMLRALCAFCAEKSLPLQVSLEERMGCGYGACVGCVCKVREGGEIVNKRVCKDGPVFDGSEVVFE